MMTQPFYPRTYLGIDIALGPVYGLGVTKWLKIKCLVMSLQGKQSNIVTSRELKPITDLGPFPPRTR